MPLAYVFDLDGVLFRGETVIAEAPRTIARLRAAGKSLFFLTNNSSQPRRAYVEKLTRLGMPCDTSEIVTSASVTADYLGAANPSVAGATAFVVGGHGIVDELARIGVASVTVDDPVERDAGVSLVIVGLDRAFRYETLLRAQQILLRDTTFIATNRDPQYPVEGGVIPGGGSIVAAVAAAAGREPITMGKPEPNGLRTILRVAGIAPGDAVMVGDRLDTDILCGNRCNVPTALVLSGVTDREQAHAATGDLKPTRVLATLDEL